MVKMEVDQIISLLGIAAAIVGVYVQLATKMKELDIRLRSVEKQDDKIIDKLDKISEAINDIKVKLQNKVDRYDQRNDFTAESRDTEIL